jgi:tetratricopeptide (TPR) repeat protein
MKAQSTRPIVSRSAFALLAATSLAMGAAPPPKANLSAQLKAAETANDQPAVAEICRRLVEANAGNLDALRKLVRTSLDLGDVESTRRYLGLLKEKAGAEDADVLEIEGDLLLREEKKDEAVAAWQAALKAGEVSAALLLKLGNHFLYTENNPDNAALYFERLLALRANAGDHIIVAEAAAAQRDWNTVIERTTTLKSEFASDNTAKRKVPALERLIDATMRIAKLDKQIGDGKAPVPIILERGLLFRELEFPEIGLIDARRALKMAPDTLYVRMAYAIIAGPVWREHEQITAWGINPHAFSSAMPKASFLEGLTRLEAPLRANPSDGAKLRERAALLLGQSQQKLAMVDLDAALATNGDDAQALRLKAEALRDLGKFGEATPIIERALSLQPKDLAILRTGIEILTEQGEFKRAIPLCDAFLTSKNEKAIVEKRALCYERLQLPVPPVR